MTESWESWERELNHEEYECCEECGCTIYNGEAYYEIDDVFYCETCADRKFRRIMDYDCI